jgi:hypothetical protein
MLSYLASTLLPGSLGVCLRKGKCLPFIEARLPAAVPASRGFEMPHGVVGIISSTLSHINSVLLDVRHRAIPASCKSLAKVGK